MSGHSKWHTIKHKKGAADAKRGKVFTRLIKELTVAARHGGGDPGMNPRLRTIIAAAKEVNMPADNIKKAIQRGTGELPGVSYEEVTYEGYGPGGAAVLVMAMTDNRNRTASDIRSYFTKSGGNLGETGSVAFMFDRTGIIEYDAKVASDDAMLEAAIDAGADDVVSSENGHEIYCDQGNLNEVTKAAEFRGIGSTEASRMAHWSSRPRDVN